MFLVNFKFNALSYSVLKSEINSNNGSNDIDKIDSFTILTTK